MKTRFTSIFAKVKIALLTMVLIMTAQTALAQVTQYKCRITVNLKNEYSGGDIYYVFVLPGTSELDANGDVILSAGNYYLNIGGIYFDGNEYPDFDDTTNEFTTPTSVNQTVNLESEYCHITIKCIALISSYNVSYETDLNNNNQAWFERNASVVVQGETVSFDLISKANYTLRHLYMREAGGSETELTFTSSQLNAHSDDNNHNVHKGDPLHVYEVSFTMPAKNVTIRAVFNKQTPTVTAPTAIAGLVYDGQPHQLINAGSTTGGTLKYKLDSGEWGTSIPEATDAKNIYTIYYKVEGNDDYEDVEQQHLTVNIAQATNTITAPTARTLTYDGTAQTLLNAGSATFGTMEYSTTNMDGSYSTTIPTRTNATSGGSYTVWYRVLGNDNYTGQGSTEIHVPIAQCPVTVTATGHTLTTTYDGQKHSVSGFDVNMSNNLYTTSDFTYDMNTEKTGTNAGEHTAELYTYGFSNLNNNFAPTFVINSPVRLVIQQKAVVVTADNVTKEQGDDDVLTATVTGLISGAAPSAISYSFNRVAGEDIGTYTITPTGNADQGNYSVTFAPGTLTISPKTIAANPDGNGNFWATYYNGTKSYTADANTTIFKGARDGNKVLLTPVDDIPAGNAVILKSKASPITLTLTSATTADFTGNDLQGRDHEVDASGMSSAYCLSKGANGVGFYKYTGNGGSNIIPAHRAFLEIADSDSNSAPGYNFLGFDETTSIADVRSKMSDIKGDYYDLQGRRVAKPTKGMYIVNGKKVIVK